MQLFPSVKNVRHAESAKAARAPSDGGYIYMIDDDCVMGACRTACTRDKRCADCKLNEDEPGTVLFDS